MLAEGKRNSEHWLHRLYTDSRGDNARVGDIVTQYAYYRAGRKMPEFTLGRA